MMDHSLNTRPRANAFTVIELVIVILVLGVLVILLKPALTKTPSTFGAACSNNLRCVGIAFRIWAIDNRGRYPMEIPHAEGGAKESIVLGNVAAVYQIMSNELNTPKILFCPADKNRILANAFAAAAAPNSERDTILFRGNSNTTYFVGLDSCTNFPNTFLSGDDNIIVNSVKLKSGIAAILTNSPASWTATRHKKQGYVLFADGSIQSYSDRFLNEALQQTGLQTNRLAMP